MVREAWQNSPSMGSRSIVFLHPIIWMVLFLISFYLSSLCDEKISLEYLICFLVITCIWLPEFVNVTISSLRTSIPWNFWSSVPVLALCLWWVKYSLSKSPQNSEVIKFWLHRNWIWKIRSRWSGLKHGEKKIELNLQRALLFYGKFPFRSPDCIFFLQ